MNEIILKQKKFLIKEHENKVTIDVKAKNYDKKIVITDEDIKVFNNQKIILELS